MIGLEPVGFPLGTRRAGRRSARGDILVVEDHPIAAAAIMAALGREGYSVALAHDGRKAVAALAGMSFDLVLTDIVMPAMDGLELIAFLRREHPELPVVAISGDSDVDASLYLRIARHYGVRATVAKPFGAQVLIETVKAHLVSRG